MGGHSNVQRKKILIVDDSETALMLHRIILQRGYDIVTAKDGRQALAVASAERPDLILLDMVMPLMDGLDACRRLRADGETRQTPIVMVTSRGELDRMEEAFRSGCSDYVLKPVRSVELLDKVKDHIGQ